MSSIIGLTLSMEFATKFDDHALGVTPLKRMILEDRWDNWILRFNCGLTKTISKNWLPTSNCGVLAIAGSPGVRIDSG